MIKAINLVRLFTIVLFLGILSLVYAYLDPVVQLTTNKNELVVHKEYFFYYSAGVFLIVNIFLWFLLKILNPLIEQKFGELSAGWFSGLPAVINVYITMLIGFVGVMNNPNDIPLGNYEYLNYLGPIILVVWLIGGIYIGATKKSFE